MNRRIFLAFAIALGALAVPLLAAEIDLVRKAEAKRIATVEKVRPSVVAVFSANMDGGGSGVVIDAEGYALTNFHVVGDGKALKCGLPDGIMYDAVLVGLDKVGDVALIKLLPKEKDKPFPFAELGDSDTVQPGDWSLAMGNPFLLANDFTPTVTFGLVSGTHRYQYPSGSILEYTDCIQIDTSINPGNSGGPLFDMNGKLVGINGRGSFDKRGRVNSGVGYAISINQIKNFLGHLYAGIDTDHATLGATVKTIGDGENEVPRILVQTMLEDADIARRGVQPEDELVDFAGRPMASVNQFKNILGIFPKGWRVPLTYRRDNKKVETLVRLQGVLPKEQLEGAGPKKPQRPGQPPRPQPKTDANSPALKLYKAKPGFANYYFNEKAQEKVLAGFAKHGDFQNVTGSWVIEGQLDRKGNKGPLKIEIVQTQDGDKPGKTTIRLDAAGLQYELDPLKSNADLRDLRDPPGSGGLLMAFYHWHRFLTKQAKGFEGGFTHGGKEPVYPPKADGSAPKSLRDLRVDAEVLHAEHAAVGTNWYFSPNDPKLIGLEVWLAKNEDPCEVYPGDYRPVDGRELPHQFVIRFGNDTFGTFTVSKYKVGGDK